MKNNRTYLLHERQSYRSNQLQSIETDVTTWNLPEGAIGRLGRGRINDIAFSPDGASFAVASHIGLWWYELATMQPVALWETERGMVSAVSFSDDGQWLATGNFDGIIKVWETQKHRCVVKIEPHDRSLRIDELTFSPDGQYISLHQDYTTRLSLFGVPKPGTRSRVSPLKNRKQAATVTSQSVFHQMGI